MEFADERTKIARAGNEGVLGRRIVIGVQGNGRDAAEVSGAHLVHDLFEVGLEARGVFRRVPGHRPRADPKERLSAGDGVRSNDDLKLTGGTWTITASGSAINVNGAKMGGKTGTSQVRSISKAERASGVLTNEQLQWNLRNHGLFVGYAPTDAPKYAVCVITEHSGSSGSAARTVSAVMKELLNKE